jgi:hypothetical protein
MSDALGVCAKGFWFWCLRCAKRGRNCNVVSSFRRVPSHVNTGGAATEVNEFNETAQAGGKAPIHSKVDIPLSAAGLEKRRRLLISFPMFLAFSYT